MDKSEIADIFARAYDRKKFCTPEERPLKGARAFKRKVLGFCGRESTRTLDEMANIFVELGMATNLPDAKDLIPRLSGARIEYYTLNGLAFDEVRDGIGNTAYRVQAYSNDYD